MLEYTFIYTIKCLGTKDYIKENKQHRQTHRHTYKTINIDREQSTTTTTKKSNFNNLIK